MPFRGARGGRHVDDHMFHECLERRRRWSSRTSAMSMSNAVMSPLPLFGVHTPVAGRAVRVSSKLQPGYFGETYLCLFALEPLSLRFPQNQIPAAHVTI
jgi:hypothetical protein